MKFYMPVITCWCCEGFKDLGQIYLSKEDAEIRLLESLSFQRNDHKCYGDVLELICNDINDDIVDTI